MSSRIEYTCDICGVKAYGDADRGWLHTQFLSAPAAEWASLDVHNLTCLAQAVAKYWRIGIPEDELRRLLPPVRIR